MRNTKFTPGPYMVERIKKGEYYVKGEGSRLCLIDWSEHHDTEARANADLFAAAPELYDALEKIINAPSASDIFFLIPTAKAALAKARGEKTDE